MTSFELFRLLKFNKNLYNIYIFILFPTKIDKVVQVTPFHAKNSYFLHQTMVLQLISKFNYASKAVEKEKWAGLKI